MDLNEPLNSQWNWDYKIPKEIKDQMPDYFYFALAGELTSVFGPIIWYEESNEDGTTRRSLGSVFSTSGYYLAFKMTCIKLGKFDVFSYYDSLSWQDSDMFDAEVKKELDNLKWNRKESENPYFYYLFGNNIRNVFQ